MEEKKKRKGGVKRFDYNNRFIVSGKIISNLNFNASKKYSKKNSKTKNKTQVSIRIENRVNEYTIQQMNIILIERAYRLIKKYGKTGDMVLLICYIKARRNPENDILYYQPVAIDVQIFYDLRVKKEVIDYKSEIEAFKSNDISDIIEEKEIKVME